MCVHDGCAGVLGFLCLYRVYTVAMPVSLVQFVHMPKHLVAAQPLVAVCKHFDLSGFTAQLFQASLGMMHVLMSQ